MHIDIIALSFLYNMIPWRAGMRQWWSPLPPTNVARVWILDPVSYVGWVCCWFSSLLRGFFYGFSGFPPTSKINISKFQFDREFEGHGFVSRMTVMCYTRKTKLIIIIIIIYVGNDVIQRQT